MIQDSASGETPPRYVIGVDGGGTGTRVLVAFADDVTAFVGNNANINANTNAAGCSTACAADHGSNAAPTYSGSAGPSGLGLGIAAAWQAIESACVDAFAVAGWTLDWPACTIGCGLAGANHAPWRDAFLAAAPPVHALTVRSDAYTSWHGAHAGAPGIVIALGTGSIGSAMDREGNWRTVGGFGFPSGDEASGAGTGLRAAAYAQQACDGRRPRDALADALLRVMAAPDPSTHPDDGERDRLQDWLTGATQTRYASLMAVLMTFESHPFVVSLRERAVMDVVAMIDALDRDEDLPVALTGSVSRWIGQALPEPYRARCQPARGDAVQGALALARAWDAASAGADAKGGRTSVRPPRGSAAT